METLNDMHDERAMFDAMKAILRGDQKEKTINQGLRTMGNRIWLPAVMLWQNQLRECFQTAKYAREGEYDAPDESWNLPAFRHEISGEDNHRCNGSK